MLSVLYLGGNMLVRQELTRGDLMGFLVSSQTIQRALSQSSVLFGQVGCGLGLGAWGLGLGAWGYGCRARLGVMALPASEYVGDSRRQCRRPRF